jgi:hypothetical protein
VEQVLGARRDAVGPRRAHAGRRQAGAVRHPPRRERPRPGMRRGTYTHARPVISVAYNSYIVRVLHCIYDAGVRRGGPVRRRPLRRRPRRLRRRHQEGQTGDSCDYPSSSRARTYGII